ncbi:kelch domain-containing protein 1-like [Dysidea avara]|uniref:kelch domain-containing protein 1-like n=1 Tax=Dysidea avara TaxID=196820 RepID=UPI003327F3CC
MTNEISVDIWKVQSRSVPAACVHDNKVYYWRGIIDDCGIPFATSDNTTDEVDVFDISTGTWTVHVTKGSIPKGELCVPMCAIWNQLFVFGGWRGRQRRPQFNNNAIHSLNLNTMIWEYLVASNPQESPMVKGMCGMVEHDGMLCIFGGEGINEDQKTDGLTNELHVFDPMSKMWSKPAITGVPPLPCARFTMTKIDSHRALIFGGTHLMGPSSEIHILDMNSWHWSGAIGRLKPEDPWPACRQYHSTCCLVNPSSVGHDIGNEKQLSQKVLVLWGVDHFLTTVDDAWILDVDTLQWTKFDYPINHGPRVGAAISPLYGTTSACDTQVLCFGGLFRPHGEELVANVTVMEFGIKPLSTCCMKFIVDHMDMFQHKLHYLPSHLVATLLCYEKLKHSLNNCFLTAQNVYYMYDD